ncbi:MAG TPA: hypothetical protein VD761_12390, partial [Solirubrobacterales bacterium]|nr:hypothetical protein [Solirubrobacterales bacterium]
MKRLKGPELKAPDLKVPPVARDLFQDLRDRRLLPLLALVLVAIVAVPFLLSDKSEDEEGTPGALATPQSEAAQAARLTVIEATPGLRDYRKRLRARVATNPFEQRYTAPVLDGAELRSETVTTTGSEATSTSTSTSTSTPGSSTGGAVVESPSNGGGGGDRGSSGSAKAPPITLFTFVVDVQYSRTEEHADGSVEM